MCPTCFQQPDSVGHSSPIIKQKRHLPTRVAIWVKRYPIDAIRGEPRQPIPVFAVIEKSSLVMKCLFNGRAHTPMARPAIVTIRRCQLEQSLIKTVVHHLHERVVHPSEATTSEQP